MTADIPPPPPPGPEPPPAGMEALPPQAPPQVPVRGAVTTDAAGRRWVWDGTQWRSLTASRRNWRWAFGLIVLVAIGIGYAVFGHQSTPTISNTKIDSPTQIEFDYHASSNCSNLTFSYTFYDSSGNKLDTWNGESSHQASSGTDYHITVTADPQSGQTISSSATRFDVTPTCHDQ